MDGKHQRVLDDCYNELGIVKDWIDSNKFHTNIRFLTAYAVIKSCGTIEAVLKQMLYDQLISGGANEEAQNHFTKHILDASFNPSCGMICRILDNISPVKKKQFESLIRATTQKSNLNALVTLRNTFAHGESINSSIDSVLTYFDSGRWVLQQLGTSLF